MPASTSKNKATKLQNSLSKNILTQQGGGGSVIPPPPLFIHNMQILLASAKTMHDSASGQYNLTEPLFSNKAEKFALDMQQYTSDEIAQMLGCSNTIAAQCKLRYNHFFDSQNTPAILAYHGQAYKHLRADIFTAEELDFAQSHLWITSFLYGLLRPLDGILPYRMEGKIELPHGDGKNMFDFWKPFLTDILIDAVKADDGILIHLATEEFQHLFDWKRVSNEITIIQPTFYVRKGDKMKIQAVWAKTCRGAMTRYIITNKSTKPDDILLFNYQGFTYSSNTSSLEKPIFVRE